MKRGDIIEIAIAPDCIADEVAIGGVTISRGHPVCFVVEGIGAQKVCLHALRHQWFSQWMKRRRICPLVFIDRIRVGDGDLRLPLEGVERGIRLLYRHIDVPLRPGGSKISALILNDL